MNRPSRRRSATFFFIGQLSSYGFLAAQGILLVPLYLKAIDVALYGAWLAAVQCIGWAALVDPGTDEVMRQRIAHCYGCGDTDRVGRLAGSGLVVNLGTALLVTAIGWWIAPRMAPWFGLTGARALALGSASRMLAIASGITVLGYAAGSVLVALQRAGSQALVSAAGAVAGIAANVLLLSAGHGVRAISEGFLVRAVVWTGGWSIVLLWVALHDERLRLRVCRHEVRGLIRFSAYTFAAKVSLMAQTNADGILAGAFLGPAQTATLVLTGRTLDAVRVVPDRIASAVQPSLAHLIGEGNPKKIREISLRFVATIALVSAPLMTIAVASNRAVMHVWVGERMYGGFWLTLCLGLSTFFSVLVNAGYHITFAHGLIPTAARVMLLFAVVKLAITAALFRSLGLLAAPVGTLAAALLVGLPLFFRTVRTLLGISRSAALKLAVS